MLNLIHFSIFFSSPFQSSSPRQKPTLRIPDSTMATTISHFTIPIVSSAAPINPRKPFPNQRFAAVPQQNKWWAPLFGWSPEPEYIDGRLSMKPDQEVLPQSGTERVRIGHEKICLRGRLTEDKARELRKKTIETSNFHDIMYHSAIASRLASDVSRSYDR